MSHAAGLALGYIGAASAFVFSGFGGAYGTWKAFLGPQPPSELTKGLVQPRLLPQMIPIIMSGVIAIYGLIISVIVTSNINPQNMDYALAEGFAHLAAGLCVGLAGLASGIAIGKVADKGLRECLENPSAYHKTLMTLVFSESIGLYGLIIALIISSKASLH